MASTLGAWPAVPVAGWVETRDHLHLVSQLVGKTKLALAPPLNHWWGITLALSATGLTTGLVPAGPAPEAGGVEIVIDLTRHEIGGRTTTGRHAAMALRAGSLADDYERFRRLLTDLDVHVEVDSMPTEIAGAVRFETDRVPRPYDGEAAHAYWRSLVDATRVMSRFRGEFRGKASPVHFFWGAFDLAVTRFSGRPAPEHPGGAPHCADWIMREAYDAEVSSAGYWPGGGGEGVGSQGEGLFYSYAYPEPEGYRTQPLSHPDARYDDQLGEFVLPYAAVREAGDPDATLLTFLRETFNAAATHANWDRRGQDW